MIELKEVMEKANEGDAEAQLAVGEFYLAANNPTQAARWFERAADNNPKAAYHLGFAYFNGVGVEKNLSKAVEYLKISADGEFVPAMAQLGAFYMGGIGVTKDEQMALFWTRRAARENDPLGMHNLGIAYYEGMGMPKNRDKAILTLQRAAELGHEKSKEVLEKIMTEEDKQWLAEQQAANEVADEESDEGTEAADEEKNAEAGEDIAEEKEAQEEQEVKEEKKGFLSRLKNWFTR